MRDAETKSDAFEEYCGMCDGITPHSVHLEIRTEAADVDEVGHSRTPYRVRECQHCGTTSSRRMNNV